jgi:hypothetical protein
MIDGKNLQVSNVVPLVHVLILMPYYTVYIAEVTYLPVVFEIRVGIVWRHGCNLEE